MEALSWQERPLRRPPLRLTALSLEVVITDAGGTRLYDIAMPIEWTSYYVFESYRRRPDDAMLRSGRRIKSAVLGAFARLPATLPAAGAAAQ